MAETVIAEFKMELVTLTVKGETALILIVPPVTLTTTVLVILAVILPTIAAEIVF